MSICGYTLINTVKSLLCLLCCEWVEELYYIYSYANYISHKYGYQGLSK